MMDLVIYQVDVMSCSFGNVIDGDSDNDGVCDDDEVLGCTDNNYLEFDILATDDDGSCIIMC